MHSGFFAAVTLTCALLIGDGALAAAVTPLGAFGAMQADGEHCQGETLDLWRRGKGIVGVLKVCAGLIDTQRAVVIENASWDERTGALAFTASFSLGTDYLGHGEEVPAKNEWRFEGAVKGDSLVGVQHTRDANYKNKAEAAEKIRLHRLPTKLPSFETDEAWTAYGGKF